MSLPRLKHLVELRNDRADEFDREVRYVGLENIAGHTGTLVGTDTIAPEGQCAMFKKGDVLYSQLRPYLNKGFIAPFDGVASTELLPLVPSSKIDSAFLLYWLLSQRVTELINGSTFGSKMPRANWSFIGDLVPPKHDLPAQRAIARYLDARTARIDALIARKQRLLELLAERRAALITRAVTRGLDPAAPTYDSGVDWLEEIPVGWEVKRLRFVMNLVGGGTPTTSNPEYWKGDIPWVSPKDMKSRIVTRTEDYITSVGLDNSPCIVIPEGEVIMVVRSGILRHSLPVAITGIGVALNQDMKALITTAKVKSWFLYYLFHGFQKELIPLLTKPGSTVESIEIQYLLDLQIPVPPLDIQNIIVDHLSERLHKFDHTSTSILNSIHHLQEYRSALITAAVNGEVDIPQPA